MEEPMVNEVFDYGWQRFRCLAGGSCNLCVFNHSMRCGEFACSEEDRFDRQNVYFKEIDNE